MKKVLYVATVDVHIKTFHLPYLKLLHENGYEVHVATNGDEIFPYCDKKHQICIERNPFRLNNLKAIKQLKTIIESEKYDLIHCHTPMGAVITRLAAKKARKHNETKVFYTAHGFHFYKGAPMLNWLLFYPIEKYLAKYTDTIITINNEDYSLAKKHFNKRCKQIEYIAGVGIDKKKFDLKFDKKEKDSLRKSLDIHKDDFVMIYPAELSKRKNQLWLIDTVKDLLKSNKKIHLVLPGKDSLNGKCLESIKKFEIKDQVHLLGFRNDIPQLLMSSDLAISSSLQEGLPVNIMESMILGLPIVATNCRGNRDLVLDGINGYLVDINEKEKFINSIKKILNSNDIKKEFSNNSKKMIDDYLLEKTLDDMKKLYNI